MHWHAAGICSAGSASQWPWYSVTMRSPSIAGGITQRCPIAPRGALVVPIQAVSLGPKCLLVHYFAAPATIALDAVHVEVDLAFSETALVVAENVPLAAGAHAANRWRALC